MSTMLSTFGFTQGEEIKARVSAVNLVGTSDPSVDSSTQIVNAQTVPQKPPSTPRRGASSSESQIEIEWDALIDP
jgi:hypothetical protein